MGQEADSNRNASLDNQKERAAGRYSRAGQSAPGKEEIRDALTSLPMKGETGGAFGKDDVANRTGGIGTEGGGGGGGEVSPPKDSPMTTGASTRRARKRKGG